MDINSRPPRSRSNSSGCGCSKIAIILFTIFLLTTNYGAVQKIVRYLTINIVSGGDVADKYVESNPWPNSPEDAVRKCFLAIESRDWNGYVSCFEPSSIIEQKEPGPAGNFYNMSYLLVASEGNIATVQVNGEWKSSSLSNASYTFQINDTIVVVEANRGALKDVGVNIPFIGFPVARKGWFVEHTETKSLPFDMGVSSANLVTPSPNFPTPTTLLTPTVQNEPASNYQSDKVTWPTYLIIIIAFIIVSSIITYNSAKSEMRDVPEIKEIESKE